MRQPGVDLQRSAFDNFGGHKPSDSNGDDLIIVAMHDERGYIESFEIFREIRLGEGLDALISRRQTALHGLREERIHQALRDLGAWPVESIEGPSEVPEEPSAVGFYTRAQLVENLNRHTI